MSLSAILEATLSSSGQQAAEEQLRALSEQNFSHYLSLLCGELLNDGNNDSVRFVAALLIKNSITAKDFAKKQELAARWMNVDLATRVGVKGAALQALASSVRSAYSGATQIIQAIAEVELPLGAWPELIPSLLESVTKTDSVDLKRNTLQALGLVCEAVDPDVLVDQANQILTAVVSGARKEEPSPQVQEAALRALYNSLEFVKANFSNVEERNYIMTIVCASTTNPTPAVQAAAFECLVKIMSLYYDYMEAYMPTLVPISVNGLRSETEEIAIQAVEFWSTVCEVEADIIAENEEREQDEELDIPPRRNLGIAMGSANNLIDALWFLMTRKEEDDDEDEWNISMAASTCLSLLATCSGNAVVQPILTFVQQHITSDDWRYKEASVMAFGSIMEGPDREVLGPVIHQALPVLISLMKDHSLAVKDTTAWTLGRVSELLPSWIPKDALQLFIASLLEGLSDKPRVASNCSWALMNLGERLGVSEEEPTYVLSPYFETMVQACNAAADGATDPSFKAGCYEAMSSLVSNSAADCMDTVNKLSIMVLERLEHSVTVQNQLVSADDKRNHYEHQSNLCGLLAACIRRMHRNVFPIADRCMAALLTVMTSASRQSTVMEDAFLTVGGLTNALESEFERYMEAFTPLLFGALQNVDEYQMCQIAVGLVGDISRSLGPLILPYCNNLMGILMTDLQSQTLNKSVKPSILSSFGDIAMAIGGEFAPYMEMTTAILQQASLMSTAAIVQDEEYGNQLREGIIEAYIGMAQGVRGTDKVQLLAPAVPHIFEFGSVIASPDSPNTVDVVMGLVGLLGDLAETLPPGQFKSQFSAPWIVDFIRSIRTDSSFTPDNRKVAKWAREVIRQQTNV
ncbi:armadillo-type protein [Geranomyces variabilis]|nr:armadillo-type protein [Geranomyces variabilis]KAJ3142821.1 karyopherin beta [Geranomyces variabilis]